MLIGYFARRSRERGFSHVDRFSEDQPAGDAQVALSYLLGLDWRIPSAINDLKDRERTLGKLRRAIREGQMGAMFGTAAAIRPELARAEERLAMLQRRRSSFQVLEGYREMAEEATLLRSHLSRLTLDIARARETIAYLERVASEEKPPAYAAVQILYEAAGIELPDMALRRMEDVERFQASVVQNRRKFLHQQLEEVRAQLAEMEPRQVEVAERRSALLAEMSGKGAFDDLARLNDELGQASSHVEKLSGTVCGTPIFSRTKLQSASARARSWS